MKKVKAYGEEYHYVGKRGNHAILLSMTGKDFVCPLADVKGLEDED